MRVTRSRELVAEGHSPSVVARVAQISRQAIYRTPKPRRAPASPGRPPTDEVEAAIVDVAMKNPTDGYRLVTAWVRRRLGRPVNRKRVLRVMRERRLIQRRRPLRASTREGCECAPGGQIGHQVDGAADRRHRLRIPPSPGR